MKRFWLVVVLFAVSSNLLVKTRLRAAVLDVGPPYQALSNNEIGIAPYPHANYLPEATQRLRDVKASTWMLASVFHSDDSIKDVAVYFKEQAQKADGTAGANALVKSLMRDNWKIDNGPVRYVQSIFGIGSELRGPASTENAETIFGVIVLGDSIVRVHLISPHPSSTDNNKLTSGTMIILIRERVAQQMAAGVNEANPEREKIFNGRDVTQRARVKSKPEPEYAVSGIGGTVVLRVVFSATGEVTNIHAVSGPSGGFIEAAIKAARKISFEPAIKDGRYVSQWIELQYIFLP
jgi:TonB family protein